MIAIIGAGAAGLATAYHLQKQGLPFTIFEKESAGSTWGKHYQGLKLHSLKQVSALPGLAMPDNYPPFPSGPEMKAYLSAYAEHNKFPIEQTEITAIEFKESEKVWELHSSSGVQQADIVVIATGIWHSPKLPTELEPHLNTFTGQQLQAKDYHSPEDVSGNSALVIGAGNSGAEIASQLAQAGKEVSILVRDGLLVLPYPKSWVGSSFTANLLRHLPPSISNKILENSRKGYPELGLPLPSKKTALEAYPVISEDFIPLVKQGKIRVVKGVRSIQQKQVTFEVSKHHNPRRLANGSISSEHIDSIIFAIGYGGHFTSFQNYIKCNAKGFPILENYRSTVNDQLFCIGYDYPATEAWLQAIKRSSKVVAKQITQRLKT